MCLKRDIEHHSSFEPINNLDDNFTLDWPLEQVNSLKLIIACNICYYPITLEKFVLKEIENENNISFGIILPIRKLFSNIGIHNENLVEQWKTVIFCPNCATILSFLNPQLNNLSERNFEKISSYINHDEQIAILQTYPLYRGSSVEAYLRYRRMTNL